MSQNKNLHRKEKLSNSNSELLVVGVGASAGGLAAFKEFIEAIPERSGMAYVLVQHLDPHHESLLPELLQKASSLPVTEMSNDLEMQPDHVYILPSDRVLRSSDGKLQLSPRPDHTGKKPYLPINLFFEALAEVYETNAVGVVLTGNGSDGTAGLKAIKKYGGFTFAQDEATAEYDSMPRAAKEEGVVDFILPPREIPEKILNLVTNFYGRNGKETKFETENADVYKQILALLRIRKGIDFTYYKQSTIRRRILRRMALNGIEDPGTYLEYLREHVKEQEVLQQDLLIPVTDFFRDEEIFGSLSMVVFPAVLKNKNKSKRSPIRIWVAGCSTGQEVYSIAICLLEFLEDSQVDCKVQIFGTDISKPAISKARSGIYTKSEIENLSPMRIERFFSRVDNNFQIKKEVREMCIFSIHNFLKDPPFGKMDLISCRNVLIYLQPYLQKKALTTFHYALKKEGYLLLGKSETTGNAPDLFNPSEKSHKIFTPRDKSGKFVPLSGPAREEHIRDFSKPIKDENARTNFQRAADEVILSRYTPPGVVVDESMEIVHFRGRTGTYLEPQAGKPDLNLMKMAKPGLAFELRSIIHHAKKNGESIVKEHIPVVVGEEQRSIAIEAIPLSNLAEAYYLILFHDPAARPAALGYRQVQRRITSEEDEGDEKDRLIDQLEKELAQAREDMRSITEEQEATNEELQSANEELQSGSEELQTLNEELETSKEELQSTNEELTTLNQELISMNKNITTARNLAVDILETVREPWIVLDSSLRIKSANKIFYKTFRTSEAAVENKSVLSLGNKEWNLPQLEKLLKNILEEKSVVTNYEITQDFPIVGERTLLLNAREIVREEEGERLILLVFGDITDKRILEKSLEKSEVKFKLLVETLPQLIWMTDAEGKAEFFNSKWEKYTGSKELGRNGEKWLNSVHPDDREEVVRQWKHSVRTGEAFSVEYCLRSAEGEYNWFLAKALPLFNSDGEIVKWFGSSTNIQLNKEAEEALGKSREQFRRLAELIPEKISYADEKGKVNYFNQSWLDYTGFNQKQLQEKGWIDLVHPEDRDNVLANLKKSVSTGANLELETRLRNKNGEYKWHLVRAIAIKDEFNQVKNWVAASTEIEKLKEEERRKEGFLQLVSHELKTPVTSIKGYVQLLLSMLDKEQTDVSALPLEPSLRRMNEQIIRLTRLISEILDLSKIEENKLDLKMEKVDLNALVEETIEDIEHTGIEHRIKVEHEAQLKTEGDKDRIEQVIINLLTNAIKYSPRNKDIEVKIFETEDGSAAVSVRDFGIGIAEKDQKEVFRRFTSGRRKK